MKEHPVKKLIFKEEPEVGSSLGATYRFVIQTIDNNTILNDNNCERMKYEDERSRNKILEKFDELSVKTIYSKSYSITYNITDEIELDLCVTTKAKRENPIMLIHPADFANLRQRLMPEFWFMERMRVKWNDKQR